MVPNGIGTGMFLNAPFALVQWLFPPGDLERRGIHYVCLRKTGYRPVHCKRHLSETVW